MHKSKVSPLCDVQSKIVENQRKIEACCRQTKLHAKYISQSARYSKKMVRELIKRLDELNHQAA